jgi:hypothetical protein
LPFFVFYGVFCIPASFFPVLLGKNVVKNKKMVNCEKRGRITFQKLEGKVRFAIVFCFFSFGKKSGINEDKKLWQLSCFLNLAKV